MMPATVATRRPRRDQWTTPRPENGAKFGNAMPPATGRRQEAPRTDSPRCAARARTRRQILRHGDHERQGALNAAFASAFLTAMATACEPLFAPAPQTSRGSTLVFRGVEVRRQAELRTGDSRTAPETRQWAVAEERHGRPSPRAVSSSVDETAALSTARVAGATDDDDAGGAPTTTAENISGGQDETPAPDASTAKRPQASNARRSLRDRQFS